MISIGITNDKLYLMSKLPEVKITTDSTRIVFCLNSIEDETTIFKNTYYTFRGEVTINDLETFIKYDLETSGRIYKKYRILVTAETESTSVDFYVIYCSLNLDVALLNPWLKENFLTLTPIQRIAKNGLIHLKWFASEGESKVITYETKYLDVEGAVHNFSWKERTGTNYLYTGDVIDELNNGVQNCIDKINESNETKADTIISVTITVGRRSATFFVDPSMAGVIPFWYRNCFNVFEQITLQRIKTEKVSSSRSVAVVGHRAQFYDINDSKDYEVQSGAITDMECVQIQQMVTSEDVRLPQSDNYAYIDSVENMDNILITDFTAEFSDTDEKPNTVKFTYRFADRSIKCDVPSSPGIFNHNFNPTFS